MVEPYDESAEFQFNQEEPEYEGKDLTANKNEKDTLNENKPSKGTFKIFFILTLILAACGFIGYKVINIISSPKSYSSISHSPVVMKKLEKLPDKNVPVSKTEIDLAPAPVVNDSAAIKREEVLTKTLNTQKQEVSKLSDQVNNLHQSNETFIKDWQLYKNSSQAKMKDLENELSYLKLNIKNLQETLEAVHTQLKRNSVALKVQAIQEKKDEERHQQVIQAERKLFVEAVIPGRAWLRAVDGSTRTVVVGDVIDGYGEVVSINAYSGTVLTSSGTKIYYGTAN